jgi:Cu/Ag efflux pump CusA
LLQSWEEEEDKRKNLNRIMDSSLQNSFKELQQTVHEHNNKMIQIMEIANVSEVAALVALRRASGDLNQSISLLLDEKSRCSILEEASKVNFSLFSSTSFHHQFCFRFSLCCYTHTHTLSLFLLLSVTDFVVVSVF